MKIGFIGLGRMGSAMAANLVRAGHEVTVFNRTAEKVRRLTMLGARAAARVADACRGDIVITMLADDAALASMSFGIMRILDELRVGAVHVSMSTVNVELTRKLARAHEEAKQQFIAAPVFGRPDLAAAAQLFIVAAGSSEAMNTCRPVLAELGQKVFELGADPAAASLVKLTGNFMIASAIETLGEAIALLSKAGVDPRTFVDLLTSTLFTGPVHRTYGALIAERRFEPAGFAALLGYKDIGLLLSASEAIRVPMPLASLLRDRFVRLLAQNGHQLDWSAIARLAADDAGMQAATTV